MGLTGLTPFRQGLAPWRGLDSGCLAVRCLLLGLDLSAFTDASAAEWRIPGRATGICSHWWCDSSFFCVSLLRVVETSIVLYSYSYQGADSRLSLEAKVAEAKGISSYSMYSYSE